MAIADGYSMASRQVGVVNVHISPGLGNSMGMLYNAFREGTPLLVTAGQQDRRLQFEEPILGSDLARVAETWTKWSIEVNRVQDLPSAVRRALQIATTPPDRSCLFCRYRMDIQMEISGIGCSHLRRKFITNFIRRTKRSLTRKIFCSRQKIRRYSSEAAS